MPSRRIKELVTEFVRGDDALADYVARVNANVGVYVGWSLAALEGIMLVSALVRSGQMFRPFKVIAYCVLGVAAVVLALLSRKRLAGTVNKNLFMGYLIGFLTIAAAYGVSNSLQDFADGKQIITFYMIMMMDTCIFVTPPVGLLNLVAVSYISFYLLGLGGHMDTGSLVNFWISSVVVTVAGFVRYQECRLGHKNEQALQHLGSHDGLTGLRNRTALRDDFPALVGIDQFVVMADLDDFKLVNDTYGHEAGDVVLLAYAKALRASFPDATIYRYGGDEFLLFVPAESKDEFKDACRKLRRRIRTVATDDGQSIPVRTSLGFVRHTAKSSSELRKLIRVADKRLYEVKRKKKAARD